MIRRRLRPLAWLGLFALTMVLASSLAWSSPVDLRSSLPARPSASAPIDPPAWAGAAATSRLPLLASAFPDPSPSDRRAAQQQLQVEAEPGLEPLANHLRFHFPTVKLRVEAQLGLEHDETVRLVLVRSEAAAGRVLQDLWSRSRPVEVGAHIAGFAVIGEGLIVLITETLQRPSLLAGSLSTFKHEYAHLVLGAARRPDGSSWPIWFEEGLAQWVERTPANAAHAVADVASGRRAAPRFDELAAAVRGDDGEEVGRAYGLAEHAVFTLLQPLDPDQSAAAIRRLAISFRESGDFPSAFESVFGEPLASFERRWRDRLTPAPSLRWLNWIGQNAPTLFLAAGAALLFVAGWRRVRRNRDLLATLDVDPDPDPDPRPPPPPPPPQGKPTREATRGVMSTS